MSYEPTVEEKSLMQRQRAEEQAKLGKAAAKKGEKAPQYLFVDADPWREDERESPPVPGAEKP